VSERKKLRVSGGAERQDVDPRQAWGVSAARLERLRDHARSMRRNPTEPERVLWEKLQGQKLGGFKFQRQRVVGSAIADFACPARWLVVEVDGDAHDTPAIDALQDKKLTDVGLRVLRFTAEAVMNDVDSVAAAILAELQKPFEKPRQGALPRAVSLPEPHASEAQREGLEAAEPQVPFPSEEQLRPAFLDSAQAEDQDASPEGILG